MPAARIKPWRWVLHRRYTIGGVILVLVGIGVAALLASAASSKHPPSASESAVYVIIAGLFQLAAAWLFSRGRPSAETVRVLFQRHISIIEQLEKAKMLAEEATDDGRLPILRSNMGELSWRLSQVEKDHLEVANNWVRLNKALLEPDEGMNG